MMADVRKDKAMMASTFVTGGKSEVRGYVLARVGFERKHGSRRAELWPCLGRTWLCAPIRIVVLTSTSQSVAQEVRNFRSSTRKNSVDCKNSEGDSRNCANYYYSTCTRSVFPDPPGSGTLPTDDNLGKSGERSGHPAADERGQMFLMQLEVCHLKSPSSRSSTAESTPSPG